MGVPLDRGPGLVDHELRERLLGWFSQRGIGSDRIHLIGALPLINHLQLYNHVDVALDPFPFSGVTTTCDALSMGIPVVSLLGRVRVGRVTASLLTAGQFPELVCRSESDYINAAVALAQISHDYVTRIARRRRVSSSPLFDGARFTRELEDVYKAMWHGWLSSS
jgi:protein O-GlcNAc transferase